MNAPARFLILVFAIVVIAAFVMAPRRSEQVAMMHDRDETAAIIAMLEPRLAEGEDDPDLLATLGRAHFELGDRQRAAELMRRYTTVRPNDGEAYAVLADIAKADGDTPGHMAMLARNVALTPSPPRIVELATLYRQQGRADEELSLLRRFETELPIASGLRLRLAQRLEETGNRSAAIGVLARVEESPPVGRLRGNQEERLFWAELLVRSGRSAEVVRLGKQWILQWREPWLANRLLRILALTGPADDAGVFGDAVMALNPEIRFWVVHQLAAEAHGVAAHLLQTWVKATPSATMDEIAGFLTACRELGEPGIVWDAFGQVLRDGASAQLTGRFSEAVVAEFGIGALAPFWAALPRAALNTRPLLEARLAFHEQRIDVTRLLLQQVDLSSLPAADQRMWLELLLAVDSNTNVFSRLRTLHADGQLPDGLLPQYARLAGGLGQEVAFQAALADLSRTAH